MEATGCLLSEAFGEIEEIKIKKKSKKDKKKTGILYPDDLKPANSHFYEINGPSNSFGSYQQINDQNIDHQKIENPNVAYVETQVKPTHQHIQPQRDPVQVINTPIQNEVTEKVKGISDKEYNEFKEYQRRKHFEIHQKQLSQMEGFSNVNDDFNDVLLFGLMGIFFLIFTDYIYKLGKKTY
jgi:hypothetical protein